MRRPKAQLPKSVRTYTDDMPSLSSLIATTYKPKSETIPLIRSALKIYKVCSYVTGTFLLLLVVEMVLKYIFDYEVQLGGSSGFIGLVNYYPSTGKAPEMTAVNLSIGILIVHGWFYVVYLLADFTLWSRMRWPFAMFILIALGGVVPFLSFIAEHFVAKRARRELVELQGPATSTASTTATMDSVRVSGVEATN
jgi:integral membrane protein